MAWDPAAGWLCELLSLGFPHPPTRVRASPPTICRWSCEGSCAGVRGEGQAVAWSEQGSGAGARARERPSSLEGSVSSQMLVLDRGPWAGGPLCVWHLSAHCEHFYSKTHFTVCRLWSRYPRDTRTWKTARGSATPIQDRVQEQTRRKETKGRAAALCAQAHVGRRPGPSMGLCVCREKLQMLNLSFN